MIKIPMLMIAGFLMVRTMSIEVCEAEDFGGDCCRNGLVTENDMVNYEITGYEEFLHDGEFEPEESRYIYFDIPIEKEIQEDIQDICTMYGLDVRIILAQMKQESCFDRFCVGDNGKAIGISQIQPRWHIDRMKRLGVSKEDLYDVRRSALVQCDFMSELVKDTGDYRKALTKYRYGCLTVKQEDYASIVFKFAEELEVIDGKYSD